MKLGNGARSDGWGRQRSGCHWRGPAYSYITRMPHHLELTDEQAGALLRELDAIIADDKYFLSPRIRALTAVRDQLRPPPKREPLPPLRNYEPPSKGRYRRY